MPEAIRRLPADERGYPVPWFVKWLKGKPEFRCADTEKMVRAVKERLCWVCGQRLTQPLFAFVIGPMCALNRISGEPPCHIECAVFSAIACPFLTKPQMRRRENDIPEEAYNHNTSLRRNPGVALVWITSTYKVVTIETGWLFEVGDPRECRCYAEGRVATPDEIKESIETGLPLLRKEAHDLNDLADIAMRKRQAFKLLGVAA